MRSNGELLGTLWEKRHDAVVVMDNKYFITLVSVHIAVIALVGCIFTRRVLLHFIDARISDEYMSPPLSSFVPRHETTPLMTVQQYSTSNEGIKWQSCEIRDEKPVAMVMATKSDIDAG